MTPPFLDPWLKEHPATNVVRFTAMFYNFSWFWGADHKRLRDRYFDWGDYAMTVSPRALRLFKKRYGYGLTSCKGGATTRPTIRPRDGFGTISRSCTIL
ncbi:MAG: hypothetical protein J6386_23275 [Candidatus Synoicihabitans palmerolidicus]|nr:hypothetical protein [Candidatus Synoicihabitans palmerolidicus]